MIGNLQMSNVDIFATGPAEQSLWWEEISLKVMTLDIADFLDNSYFVSTFGGPSSTPSSSKQKLRSTQSSLLCQQRRRPTPHFEDTNSHSEEEEEDKDEEVEQEGEGENTIFIIMREFHDFEKIQIRLSRADLSLN